MKQAAERLAAAISRKERIAVFGDYDVDGISGTALLSEFLEALGASPIALLPDRLAEGYGISAEIVEGLCARGASLIVTVDNGTRAVHAVGRARELGVDVIITDHHDAGDELPNATAIVNPKLSDDDSPLHGISGCGVAFMLALAVRRLLREKGLLPAPEPNLKRCLDLVALGTIADVVPLTGANRMLTRFGLSELANAHRAGVRALLESSCTAASEITTGAIAFRLAPRINAAGRLGDAHEALSLLRSTSNDGSRAIAAKLELMNRERQRMEERMFGEALSITGSSVESPDGALVVHSEAWHPGVIGIVAAKLAERMLRPAVVIAGGPSQARGSARSNGYCDLVAALSCCRDCLLRFGGHSMAAGLSIEPKRVDEFRRRFSEACAAQAAQSPAPSLAIDACVAPSDINEQLVEELGLMQPFGAGNPEPLLAIQSARIIDKRTVGTGHLKLKIEADGSKFDAIGFNMADAIEPETKTVALAFSPQLNTWNGVTSVQLKLKDIAPIRH